MSPLRVPIPAGHQPAGREIRHLYVDAIAPAGFRFTWKPVLQLERGGAALEIACAKPILPKWWSFRA
jgi:hypothetical protein